MLTWINNGLESLRDAALVTVFKNTEQLYSTLDRLLREVSGDATTVRALLAGNFVLRFRYREPDGQITIDLRGDELNWEMGPSALEPQLELIQSGDTTHEFWKGSLNVPLAIASRKVVARGDVTKALKLLPAVKTAFPIYQGIAEEMQLQNGKAPGASRFGPVARLVPLVTGMRTRIRAWRRSGAVERLRTVFSGAGQKLSEAELQKLNEHFIPISRDVPDTPAEFRKVTLPTSDKALAIAMHERMLLIRAFEEKLSALYADGSVPTEAIHLSIGQEATAVGVCFALRADDMIATTHRGHGHVLAKGAPIDGMMAEILGKRTGLCKGKGGSMHVTDASVGVLGANGIVGASALIATGAAHSAKLRGSDSVAVAFLGDGATNQGMFHEAVNFAAVFDLPVVFAVENNQYGEFTALGCHTRVTALANRARAYGVAEETVDGNDVRAVWEATKRAVERARVGKGPTLLVCETYRWHGHMEGESVTYRSDEEIAEWKQRCPISASRNSLKERRWLSSKNADVMQNDAIARVDAALKFAQQSPEPTIDDLTDDVYAPEPEELYARPASQASRASRSSSDHSKTGERHITCAEAIREALSEEMARDERVYLLGEDVTRGGYFAVTTELIERFGEERVVDTPISEYAIVGSAVGAAMTESRPVAEILFSDFLTTCMDPIVNNAAKLRYMSGGQYRIPLVVRTPGGGGLGMAAQHSQSFEALLAGIPGLIVIAPATPADAKGLLKAAIRSNNPVLFFENKLGYTATGPVPIGEYVTPIGVADVKREGRDVTLVPIGGALNATLAAAERLSESSDRIEAEVIDPRTLVPLDIATIVRSVAKTGRLVTVEEAPEMMGFGAEIVAKVTQHAFRSLRSAPVRIAATGVPIPYNIQLERAAIPDIDRIERSVRAALA